MIIATFNHGFNVSVKDSGGHTVWNFSTTSGQYFTKYLPTGDYCVYVGIPERTLAAKVVADGMVGVVGSHADFTLMTSKPG